MTKELPCPSCGAPLQFESSIALVAVCAYCRGVALRKDLDVTLLGKAAQLLEDGSPLRLGSVGVFADRSFVLAGRLQLRFDSGLWNEWFLRFEDEGAGWLGEAQGFFAVTFPLKTDNPVPAYDSLALGQELILGETIYTVKDKRFAEYLSAEGELPFTPPLGETAALVDLAGENRRCATIDYSEDKPLVFAGTYADFEELKLERLREIPGW